MIYPSHIVAPRVRCAVTLLSLAALSWAVTGCGQQVTVTVTRLSNRLGPRPEHPVAQAGQRLLNAATALQQNLDALAAANPAAATQPFNPLHAASVQVQAIREKLMPNSGQALPLEDLIAQARALQEIVYKLQTGDQLANMIAQNVEQLQQLRPELGNSRQQILSAFQQTFAQAMVAINQVYDAPQELTYGGFKDNSVYTLSPASHVYDGVNLDADGQVMSRVELDATGDSGVMLVQDTPASFTPRQISSDPTEAIRATLVVANRVLRVVAAFMPELAGVTLPEVAASTPATGNTAAVNANAGATPSGGDPVVSDVAAKLRALKSDANFKAVLDHSRDSTKAVTAAQEQALFDALQAILREYAARPTTAGSTTNTNTNVNTSPAPAPGTTPVLPPSPAPPSPAPVPGGPPSGG